MVYKNTTSEPFISDTIYSTDHIYHSSLHSNHNIITIHWPLDDESDKSKQLRFNHFIFEFLNQNSFQIIKNQIINELSNLKIIDWSLKTEKNTNWEVSIQFNIGHSDLKFYHIQYQNNKNMYDIKLNNLNFIKFEEIPYIKKIVTEIFDEASKEISHLTFSTNKHFLLKTINNEIKKCLNSEIEMSVQHSLYENATSIISSNEFKTDYDLTITKIVRQEMLSILPNYTKFVPKYILNQIVDEYYIQEIMES